MNKKMLIVIGLVLVIGSALFYDQILAVFSGMSAIEAIKFIVSSALNATVGGICAYVLFGLPKIIKPWARMFRKKQRSAMKIQRAGVRMQTIPQRAPTTNRVMSYLLNQLGVVEKKPNGQPQAQEPVTHIKLDM